MNTEEIKKQENSAPENLFAEWQEPGDVSLFETAPAKEEKQEEKKTEEKPEEIAKEEKTDETLFEDWKETPESVDTLEEQETTESEKTEEVSKEKTENVKTKKVPSELNSLNTLRYLEEKGLVEYNLNEGQELTEELAEDIFENSFEDKVESRVGELMEELPTQVKEIVKYAMKGGNVDSLFTDLAKASANGVTAQTDMTQEANQIAVVKQSLASQRMDQETIDAQIEFFKDSGKLELFATKAFDKVVEQQAQVAARAAEQQKLAALEAREKQKEYERNISSKLKETKELKGFKFTPKEKRDLATYIAKPTQKLTNGNVVSSLQLDLYNALQNQEKTILLAKLLKNDFDMSSFNKTAKTEVTQKVKEELQNYSPNTKTRKGNLSDFF